MKLKNLKAGKKQTKKQQPKPQVQQVTKVQDDEELRDDALIDIKQDLKKKQQNKPKVNKRVEASKFEQVEIDTSKIIIEKTEETKKPITSWVVNTEEVKDLLKQDFKHVDHEFQSLTDTKLNEELKQKKQKHKEQQKNQTVGGFKFAPLASDPLESKTTDKITLGKPKTETTGISFSPAPALNFTNTKMGSGNVNVAPLEKAPQLYDDDIEKRMQQRMAERNKIQAESKPIEKGKGWFKQPVKEAPKEAPKIQFKASPLTFTNSAISNQGQEQQFKGFQPLEKSKQEQIYEKEEQSFKFSSKKEAEERKKKREEEQAKLQLQGKVQPVTVEKA